MEMKLRRNILANTLEGMAADADDKGKDCIRPNLNFDDVKIILDAINKCDLLEETEASPVLCDTEHNSPLSDTVEGMLHPDYKERFKAEYQQTKIRYEKLKAFNNRIEAADRTCSPFNVKVCEMPKHDCPSDLLREQQSVMGNYLHLLEVRAVIEGIDLASL